MKKQLNSAISFTLAATFAMSNLFGQSQDVAITGSSSTGKKVRTSGAEYSKNVKVDRTFAKTFSHAKNISWKQSGDEYIVNFKLDDRLAVAWFTKTGKLYCANYYGTAVNLPAAETQLLAQYYPEYQVTATIEISKGEKTVYVVTIQSCNNQKKVKVIDGEIEEMETLKLAK